MCLFEDFKAEINSQISIVYYIQQRFEKELKEVAHFVNLPISDDIDVLYNNNSQLMSELLNACEKHLKENECLYKDVDDLPEWVHKTDIREPLGELIEFCIESIGNGTKLSEDDLIKEIDRVNDFCEEKYFDISNEKLKEIIPAAQTILYLRRNNKLLLEDEKIQLLETTIKLVDNASSSNIFRQAFISIFSLFDAFVFDCLKQYFYKNPKELKVFFKNNELLKMGFEEIIEQDNIDALKNEVIHRQFEGRYLSEIISKLKIYKKDLFNNLEYEKIMEMIERRNIHIHNKGLVDERYHKNYNIYKFNIGEYAYIDNNYLLVSVFNTFLIFSEQLKNLLKI